MIIRLRMPRASLWNKGVAFFTLRRPEPANDNCEVI